MFEFYIYQGLQDKVNLINNRLGRANRLTTALAEEEIRWTLNIKDLTSELWTITGDVLLSAASVAYLGPFSATYRVMLTDRWLIECENYKIAVRKDFRFA